MKIRITFLAMLVALAGAAQAQQGGSIHYTGRSTPYTGQMTPVYTGRSTPYTGRPVMQSTSNIPNNASKSGSSIHRSGRRGTGQVNRPPVYRPPLPPALGSSVDQLPARHRSTYYEGYTYYYGNGYYYRTSGNVAPLVYSSGFGEHYKARQRREEAARGTQPGSDSGRFSKSKSAPMYEVVAPPLGLVVENLPPGARQVKKGLYFHQDAYYRPTYSEGKVQYIVTRG